MCFKILELIEARVVSDPKQIEENLLLLKENEGEIKTGFGKIVQIEVDKHDKIYVLNDQSQIFKDGEKQTFPNKILQFFIMENGNIITISPQLVQLWSNETLICQIVFSDSSCVLCGKYMDSILLLQHQEDTLFSVIKVEHQFVQLNLLSMPQLPNHPNGVNSELFVKQMAQGQVMINVRHLTKVGTVRDFMTVVTDCRELHQ